MKKWLKKFDDVMTAATFAEAGEFDIARESLKEQRTILLAMTGEKSDANSFRYAVNVCKRIDAGIEILFSGQHSTELMKSLKSELKMKSIDYSFIKVDGCVKEAVLKYTTKRKEILFVVIESSDGLDLHCNKSKKAVSQSWKSLKCPLVIVSDLATA
jgi:hypothetical protein